MARESFDGAANRSTGYDGYPVDAYKERLQPTVTDPRQPAGGEKKVLRDGAWRVRAKNRTSWACYCEAPGFTDACVVSDEGGFRCVRSPP